MNQTIPEKKVFVDCPLCAQNHSVQICAQPNAVSVVQCRSCNFMYLNPRPITISDTENDEAYYTQYKNAAQSQTVLFNHRFREFLSGQSQGRVLDIGCATGNFLKVAEQFGWDTYGIDLSQWACDYLRKSGFDNIFNATLEEINFKEAYFDAVHLSHVLEHIPDPIAFLVEIKRILKPGGRVIIEVPNEARFPLNYKLIHLLQPRHAPRVEMTDKHLSLFTPHTLKKMLYKGGLTPLVLRSEGFGAKGRMQTPMFQKKTVMLLLMRFAVSLNLDVHLGFGRYIVAMAEKHK
jgi:2-polyprenyl-3-methyl-5-hydroxy-6-metoxy-1,4-benzoquinol methylase